MRRLAHISDLHFGKTDPKIVREVAAHLHLAQPDLLVVTGDVTQRARKRQFAQARSFFAGLPFPRLIVPGNHDLAPIYRPVLRARNPFENYRHFIAAELDSVVSDEEFLAIGLNTAHALRPKEGMVTPAQVSWVEAQLSMAGPRFVIVAAHHPLLETRGRPLKRRVRGGERLLAKLERARVDLVLSGHLHESFSGPAAARLGAIESAVVVQSSTTTSTRLRGHLNAFNLIELDSEHVRVDVNVWNGTSFELGRSVAYVRREGSWVLVASRGDG